MASTPSRVAPLTADARIRWGLLFTLLGAASCSVPNFEGPQIQSPPDAFFLQPDSYQGHRMFPELDIVYHTAWVNTAWGEFSTIYINGHSGKLGRAHVETALAEAQRVTTEPVTFGALEELTIDDREAWGWAERLETPTDGLEWIAYRVVIPYDTVTYAVELFSGDPFYKRQPETLRAVAASFAVGKTRMNLPLVAVIVGLALLAFNLARTRARERDARMKSITLVTIPKPEENEGEEGTAAPRPLGMEKSTVAPTRS